MSGGGARYFPSRPSSLHNLIEKARETEERQQLEGDVNELLHDILTTFNQRDSQKIQDNLEEIKKILGRDAEIEKMLFGGSIAKHTYIDGLSDVDALVILENADLGGESPEAVLDAFYKSLRDRLTYDLVKSVEKGTLAVTVNYRDGTTIQLLPALRAAGKVIIPDADGDGWKETNPKLFQQSLTRANERLEGCLVPAIKLVKSIVNSDPADKRLRSHHVEALALDAVRNYRGAATVKTVLLNILHESSKRVLSPIADVTGQSRVVDSYLGKANSTQRRALSRFLADIGQKLNSATSADQWKAIL